MTTTRSLTVAEGRLAKEMFGDTINYDQVRVHRRKWWPFQPKSITMAPDGHLWFHPEAPHYRECFGCADINSQSHFIHEMTHVWQASQAGRWWLPLMRHPFCRYDYTLVPGKPFSRYGVEQQAEIVRNAFLARRDCAIGNDPALEALLPFCSDTA